MSHFTHSVLEPVAASAGWDAVPAILARIERPRVPRRDFDVRDSGARPHTSGAGWPELGGVNTAAFTRAIAACHAAGGGRVVVPAGDWPVGPIHLRSGVELHVTRRAALRFSTDPADYLPPVFTRWEGVECFGYSPFVYAIDAEDVAVTGEGLLDGQAGAGNWWAWKGPVSAHTDDGAVSAPSNGANGSRDQRAARDELFATAEAGFPVSERVFAEGSFLRPQFIQFYRCRRVLISGVHLRGSPMWAIHPVLCTSVTVSGVTVHSHGPNNDGCNPESCGDVLIEDCIFDCGDDCITLKSGRNADGRRLAVPVRDVVVRRCTMRDGHGGIVVGSEISGGCRGVYVEDCHMSSPRLERALRIKTNSYRGGVVEDVFLRRITVGEVSDAVVRVNFHYEEGDGGPHPPVVRNLWIEELTSRRSCYALFLAGYARSPVRGVHLRACQLEGVERPSVLSHVADLCLDGVELNGAASMRERLHDRLPLTEED